MTEMVQDIQDAFEKEKLKPSKVSVLYQLALSLVALMMVLLPLIYVGIVGLVGWGVYYHATENLALFDDMGGRAALLAYFTPLVVGVICFFFLTKPLLARRPQTGKPFVLKPGEEPGLELFVEKICRAVGASEPREIELNAEVNAAAAFRRGWLSLFGKDLKLVIGLPLVAGMNMRSFGGVLAHEFGHFAQGLGMRLTYIVRSVNAWFARVVYERDSWDVKLEDAAESWDGWISLILHIARFFVWLSRRILWCLMHVGHAISCFALRQMEYDADSYEVQFAGSETFAKTSHRLQMLGIGSSHALQLVQESWNERKLSRNLPQLGRIQADALPEDVVKAVADSQQTATTGFFDTHPCDSDRISAAIQLAQPGIFRLEEPAALLFKGFDDLSQRLTQHYYRHEIGLEIGNATLVDNQVITGQAEQVGSENEAIDWLTADTFHFRRPITLSQSDVADTKEDPDGLRQSIAEHGATLTTTVQSFAEASERLDKLLKSQAVLRAGFEIDPDAIGVSESDSGVVTTAIEKTRGQMNFLARGDLDTVDRLVRDLLAHTIAIRSTDDDSEVSTWSDMLVLFDDLMPLIGALRDQVVGHGMLLQLVTPEGTTDVHVNALRASAKRLKQSVREICDKLEGHHHPFDEKKQPLTALFEPDIDPTQDPVFISYEIADSGLNHLLRLYLRILGNLAKVVKESAQATNP